MPGMTHTEQQDQAISPNLHAEDPQPSHEIMHGPKKRPAAIITIIIIVLAAVIGVALFLNRQTTGGASATVGTASGSMPSPIATGGMTAYEYGMDNELLFSYPATWYPHDKHGILFFLKAPNTPDKDGTEIYAYGQQITIADSNLTDNKGNKLTRPQYDRYMRLNPPANKDPYGNPIKRTEVKINGIPMTRIDQLEYIGTYRTLSYEILKDELMYVIRLYPYAPDGGTPEDKQNIQDFEALIQTVHFAK